MPADPITAAPLSSGRPDPAEVDPTATPLGGRHGLDLPTLGMICTPLDRDGLSRSMADEGDAWLGVRVALDADAPLGFECTRRLEPFALDVGRVLREATAVLADVGWIQVSPWRDHPDQAGSKGAQFIHPDVTIDRVTGRLEGGLPCPTSDPIGDLA